MSIHLKDAGYSMDICADGEDGLVYALQNSYDLILLDRLLPSLDGIEVLSRLRKKGIVTPVLMVTALNTVEDRVDGLDAGADDYLIKPFATKELLARVRALLRRTPQLDMEESLCVEDVALNLQTLTLRGALGSSELSKKEAELLELLFKNYEKTIPRAAIFAHIWGPMSESEDGNLDTYIHFARRRLRAVSDRVRIATIRMVGYRLEATSC